MKTELVWVTPNADAQIAYLARVSNPKAQPGDPSAKLISYLLKHNHWSPFEMANACVEIHTSRDIARQILRHRSFSFQEFSQRYAEVTEWYPNREARLQDSKNRQNSIQTSDENLKKWFESAQDDVKGCAEWYYREALKLGIAKEQARALLPEGLTPTKMYMNGSIRSWLTYFTVRTGNGTQLEHQEIAKSLVQLFKEVIPSTMKAWEEVNEC
jgi:thymidylate synthase (FAD)